MITTMLFLSLQFFTPQTATAEPWVSNRFAQNCAGCHAPGRFNRPPIGRRCTLSCQGCHVNPNGGGMRNKYGVWNDKRWLKSMHSDTLRNDHAPAPYKYQKYKKVAGRKTKRVYNLNVIKKLNPPEKFYDKHHDKNWLKEVPTLSQYLSTIPYEDPYRQERRESIQASGDLRYLYGKVSGDSDKDLNFLMNVDLGIRLRPIKEKLSFVFEHRYLNNPNNTELESVFTTESRVRSAYVLVDDLAYNTYAMAGLYRPMFGNYTPDHTSLSQQISGLDQRAVYKGIGFGAAPNVPFFTFNYLMPMQNTNYSQDEGFVFTGGGRFVTLGASATISHWNTEKDSTSVPGLKVKKEMTAIALGTALFNSTLILNGELLNFSIQDDNANTNSGTVMTFEGKYKVWRESYLTGEIANSNTAVDTTKGSATSYAVGYKIFLVPGVELDVKHAIYNTERQGSKLDYNTTFLQAHLYF
ncbi:MAG: hypothetical protein MK008_01720 [Bdellovibrionales bacterium]|nr:hypothetical protein [Bdellovibrionales bacterium]